MIVKINRSLKKVDFIWAASVGDNLRYRHSRAGGKPSKSMHGAGLMMVPGQ